MNQLLERAIAEALALPDQRQNEVGEMVLALVEQESSHLQLSPAHQAEVRRRMAESNSLVPEQEMQDFFRKLTV